MKKTADLRRCFLSSYGECSWFLQSILATATFRPFCAFGLCCSLEAHVRNKQGQLFSRNMKWWVIRPNPYQRLLILCLSICLSVSPPRWLSGKGVRLETSRPGFDSRFQHGSCLRLSYNSDSKTDTTVTTLPAVWRYRDALGVY